MLQHAALCSQIWEVFRRATAEEHSSSLLDIVTLCAALLEIFWFSVLLCAETLKSQSIRQLALLPPLRGQRGMHRG